MPKIFTGACKAFVNLQYSAKLGERQLTTGNYGEWVWWNNRDWVANVARPDKIEKRKFLRDEAKEFQLRKTRFGDKAMHMMLDIESPPPGTCCLAIRHRPIRQIPASGSYGNFDLPLVPSRHRVQALYVHPFLFVKTICPYVKRI